MDKIRVSSADSHLMEPEDLWTERLPERLGSRAPRTEKDERYETIYVDGQKMYRTLSAFHEAMRPPGAFDIDIRLEDLDREGVWGQLAFPSMGLWLCQIEDRELARATVAAYNDWAATEVIARTPRILPAAIVSTLDVDDAVEELQRAAGMGFQLFFLPTEVPEGLEYALDRWEPLWAAAEEAAVLPAFHIGTGGSPVVFRGPGGAIVNYVETTFPGQRVVTHMVASGALDRHPDLKILIAEGGCSWVPALGDRMDEAYRQHDMFVDPKLSMLPSELIHRQVYASFQHDRTAVPAVTGMGYRNVMWGDDYPHLEGTYGHTQETLHKLFDDAPDDVRHLITEGNFNELFEVPERAST